MLKPRPRKPDLYRVWPHAKRRSPRFPWYFPPRALIRNLGFAAILFGIFTAGKWLDVSANTAIAAVAIATVCWIVVLYRGGLYRQRRWHGKRTSEAGSSERLPWGTAAALFMTVFVVGFGILQWRGKAVGSENGPQSIANTSRTFGLCHTGGGQNCVVDGDTFWMDGVKVRVADIDAPETHPPRCPHEADLGSRATERLRALLNAGSFELKPLAGRDEDRYGRKLRVAVRDGHSLGDQLVREGLARTWTGRREPWC